MSKRTIRAGIVLLSVAIAVPAAAPAQVAIEINGDAALATVELAGGIAVDVTIGFEEALGLSASSLGLDAQLVSLSDPALLTRLPSGASLSSAFPLMLTIEPPLSGPLSFRGVVSIELHTHQLEYTAGTPLRLFAAPLDGPFRDITSTMGMGSYRVRGTKGGFSQFLILADLRDADPVIDGKFSRLQDLLDASAASIPAIVHDELQDTFDAAWSAWSVLGDAGTARTEVESFAQLVREHGGTAIPDVWRSSRDLVNVAGELRAAADTLRFGLNLRSSALP